MTVLLLTGKHALTFH